MIAAGMTSAQFIAAINSFYEIRIGSIKTDLTSVNDVVDTINGNATLVAGKYSEFTNVPITYGMTGAQLISALESMDANAVIMDTWILAGQSNMTASTAIAEQTIEGYADVIPYGFIWHNNASAIKPLEPGVNTSEDVSFNDYPTYFGPETSFAKDLIASSGRSVAIVKLGNAGCTLYQTVDKDFNVNSVGDLYDRLKGYITNADTYLTSRNVKMRIRGIFWVQGEGDRNQVEQYAANLSALFTGLRQHCLDINAANGTTGYDIINIIGGVSSSSVFYSAGIRTIQTDFITNNGDIFINPDGLELKDGNVHFTADAIITIGQNAAAAVAAL